MNESGTFHNHDNIELMIDLKQNYDRILHNLSRINLLEQACEQIGKLNGAYWNIMRVSSIYPFYSYGRQKYEQELVKYHNSKHDLLVSININDYIGLFTFNEHDFARFPLANPMNRNINDNIHGSISINTLENITYGFIEDSNNPPMRNHVKINPIMSMRVVLLQNIFASLNDYIDDDARNTHIHDYNHVIDYANDIIQGYPMEFALEKLKINSYYDDSTNNSDSETALMSEEPGASEKPDDAKGFQLIHYTMKRKYARMMASSDAMHGFINTLQLLTWIITN